MAALAAMLQPIPAAGLPLFLAGASRMAQQLTARAGPGHGWNSSHRISASLAVRQSRARPGPASVQRPEAREFFLGFVHFEVWFCRGMFNFKWFSRVLVLKTSQPDFIRSEESCQGPYRESLR